METYIIDKIRQIAIGTCGEYDYDYCRGVYEVQGCRESVTVNGRRYPVIIIGDEFFPILQEEWRAFGEVKEFLFHNGIKRIAKRAFSDIIFENAHMELPESLLEIGNEAFLESKMKKIVIPRNVIHIGEDAFPPEMEVECLSPYLIREDGNNFTSKTYHVEGIPLEFRITDPIKKEVSATCFTGENLDGFVFPDIVNIGGDDYLVTAIDSDFECFYGDFVLPPHLRKIANDIEFYNGFCLPETLKYFGKCNIYSLDPLHLPEGLRFIADEMDCSEFVNHSPYINLDKKCVLDEDGKALYFFGRSYKEKNEFYKNIKSETYANYHKETVMNPIVMDGGIDGFDIYDAINEEIEGFDYEYYWELLNSSTF